VPNLGCKEGVEPLCHGILSLCTAMWPCVVVMQKKHVSFQPDSADALLE